MNKLLIPILLLVVLLSLSGCGNNEISDTSESDKVLLQAINDLSKINSYELTSIRNESTSFGDKKIISNETTEQELMFEPFVTWSRTDSTSTGIYEGGERRTLRETYQILTDGQLDLFWRYSPAEGTTIGNEPVLGEWEKVFTSTKEQADWTIDMIRNNFEAQIYLLSSNVGSFKIAQNNESKDENILQFEGYLDQTTILEAYQKYIRGTYVEWNLLADSKDMTPEDLKNEIVDGELLEIKTGIPKLAYSEKPVPISLWIDKNNFELKKVTIDETLVMQSYMEKEMSKANPDLKDPIVSQALLTYEIKSINTINDIPMPD